MYPSDNRLHKRSDFWDSGTFFEFTAFVSYLFLIVPFVDFLFDLMSTLYIPYRVVTVNDMVFRSHAQLDIGHLCIFWLNFKNLSYCVFGPGRVPNRHDGCSCCCCCCCCSCCYRFRKMPKALLTRNGKLRNLAYTFVTSFPTDLPS